MDRLEQYLDQVCRCIGGPRSMRRHVRQELREHLLDAVAQHRAAGMAEEEAVTQALEEFGKPEEVRSELEAAHGQRMFAVVIEKAMQWKEKTMRAKWLWTTTAFLGLLAVIALEVMFITFKVMYIVPKYQKLLREGMVDHATMEEHGLGWIPTFLNGVQNVTEYSLFIVLGVAILWGLFEWRVQSENKTFMRLTALGVAATGLMVVVALMGTSLAISFVMAMPAMSHMSRPFALEQVAAIDKSLTAIEQARMKKDWEAVRQQAKLVSSALTLLAHGPALNSLTRRDESPTLEELRSHVKAAHESLGAAQKAVAAEDAKRLEEALAEFRKSFDPVREASKKPPR